MGLLMWVAVGLASVGAALLLWCEWREYRRVLTEWDGMPWWEDGKHDEVEKYPPRLFGERGEGGDW